MECFILSGLMNNLWVIKKQEKCFWKRKSFFSGVKMLPYVHILGVFLGQNATRYTHFGNLFFSEKKKKKTIVYRRRCWCWKYENLEKIYERIWKKCERESQNINKIVFFENCIGKWKTFFLLKKKRVDFRTFYVRKSDMTFRWVLTWKCSFVFSI